MTDLPSLRAWKETTTEADENRMSLHDGDTGSVRAPRVRDAGTRAAEAYALTVECECCGTGPGVACVGGVTHLTRFPVDAQRVAGEARGRAFREWMERRRREREVTA